jgi:hypothetical protein
VTTNKTVASGRSSSPWGLFAPSNAITIASLLLAALSVSGAIFLIVELDQPFDGVIQISSAPMRTALAHLGH